MSALTSYAYSQGFDVVDVFLDTSLKRSKRTEFDRLLSCCGKYDALVAKDFHHISINTGECIRILQQLRNSGLMIYTVENGDFTWGDPPFGKPLRVATYTCHFGTPNEMKEVIPVRNDIFTLFTDKKTNWTVFDQYYDESLRQKDSEQVQMKELISNRDRYDLLLVHNLTDVHWRTANFFKTREKLHMDIYSLQEGFLKYRKI